MSNSHGKAAPYKAPIIYSQFSYDPTVLSDMATVKPPAGDVSLTVQSQAEDADINVLMKRFGLLGVMPATVRVPEYGDYSEVTDYQTALNAVLQADQEFGTLTPEVRARFDNDPQRLLEFVNTPGNEEEGYKLGLFTRAIDKSGKVSYNAPKLDVPVKEKEDGK